MGTLGLHTWVLKGEENLPIRGKICLCFRNFFVILVKI